MPRFDVGSVIVIQLIILVFLLVIIGMMAKCGDAVSTFLNEVTTITTQGEPAE